jgi:hypothetical protein
MLPSLVAQEIREGLRQFLVTGFEPSNAGFRGLVQRFLEQPEGLDKGHYLSLGLPNHSKGLGGSRMCYIKSARYRLAWNAMR